ncbi:ATL57, partial [Symbiodinium pilosum]
AWQLCGKDVDDVEEVVDLRDCSSCATDFARVSTASSPRVGQARARSSATCQTLEVLGPDDCSESSASSVQNVDFADGLDLDSVLRVLSAEDTEEAGGLSALLANSVYAYSVVDTARSDSTAPSTPEEERVSSAPAASLGVRMDFLRQPPSSFTADWQELMQSHRSSACSGYSAGAMSVESPTSSPLARSPQSEDETGSFEASIQELFDMQSVASASIPNSARSHTVSMARGFDAAEETLSVVDIADEMPASPQSEDGQSMHIVYGASVAASPRSFASPRIENMGSLLQRWALEHQLDENVASSIRRVLEVPDLLPDMTGLTEEEIRALPKVQFSAKDMQQCSICLEAFQEGELLTSLRCGHFFHV